MDIRFVSTLTSEDEERVASVVLAALVALFEGLPIAYALRIETSGQKVFHRTNTLSVPAGESVSDSVAEPLRRAEPS